MISLAFLSLSVLVTSLCFSLMCMFLAASVAYSLPQLYKQGNSFWSSLAHLLTCFFLQFSLLVFLISILCIRLFIMIQRGSSLLPRLQIEMSRLPPVWDTEADCCIGQSSKLLFSFPSITRELIFFGEILNFVTLDTLNGLNICLGF